MVISLPLLSLVVIYLLLISYTHFRDIANHTDMNAPYDIAGASFLETPTRSTAKRLRRTRQHLGSYRHDLIVAMRVVNHVEKEILQAEWENWLLDENTRCGQAETMLRENRTNTSHDRGARNPNFQHVLDGTLREKGGRLDDLREWHAEYCSSCKLEQVKLLEGRQYLTFG